MAEIVCLQLGAASDPDRRRRVDEVAHMIASMVGVDLVVLPELWPCGYFDFDGYRAGAETADGPTVTALAEAAAAARAHVVGGSFVEAGADGALHNTAFVLSPDGDLLATYRKIHVFGYQSREAELVTHGARIATVSTPLGRLGLAVCYDLRFPELFRAQVDAGAELLVLPAAWPAARIEHWRLLLRARALENQCLVIGCNASGTDHEVTLGGRSAIIDPTGRVLAEGGTAPGTLRASVDLESVVRARREFPVLADRRLPEPISVRA
jgi:predicted amidohydrolase